MAKPAPGTFLDAAVKVLRDAERPLTVQEITGEALRRGLLATKGKTPDSSMSAVLYDAEKRPETGIGRLYQPGESRARRGSVRWTVKDKRDRRGADHSPSK